MDRLRKLYENYISELLSEYIKNNEKYRDSCLIKLIFNSSIDGRDDGLQLLSLYMVLEIYDILKNNFVVLKTKI